MKILISLCFMTLVLVGCYSKSTWTKQEIQDWYSEYVETNPSKYGPLLYRGSDDKYHYFAIRTFDSWNTMKVIKEEIKIEDIRGVATYSGDNYLGYYAVDPNNKFIMLEK